MIRYTRRAQRQVAQLIQYYADRERYEAIRAFRAALDEAETSIESSPTGGLPAPRPYKQLTRQGVGLGKSRPLLDWLPPETTPHNRCRVF